MKIIALILLTLLLTACSKKEIPLSLQKEVDSLVLKWVPDQREGICTIKLSEIPDGRILVKGETNIPGARTEILNAIITAGYKMADSLLLLPDLKAGDRAFGLVSISVCNIKKNPSHSSELLSQAVMGTPLKILKRKGGWLFVQTPDYYLGWVSTSGVSELSADEYSNWKKSERVIYLNKGGDILLKSTGTEVLSDIVSGSIVEVKNKSKEFCEIKLPDGRSGFLKSADVKDFRIWASTVMPEADKLIAFAKTLLGSPYLWGGTSTKAIDCSGFVKTIYFTGGLIMARDASLQFLHGQAVDISSSFEKLEKGDLLFFGSQNSKGEKKIIHVGMYIGNTEVIHSSGMVRINSIDSARANYSSYLGKTIQGAGRIIGTVYGRGSEKIDKNHWYFIPE